ncbi:hypothetical protein KKB68_02520, partial [Patescibacteria group bacterium]|nr:hypothetical protein [Patescibacteria group bacterium]
LCNPENFDYFEYFEKKLKGFNAQILTMESWPPQFQFSGLTSENCPKVREIVIASGLTQKVSECRERPLYPTWPEPEETVEEVIRVERVEKVISKIEFNFNELNEAKKKGEVKFLQYAGREEINNTTLEKIRYTNKEGTIITEIKIDSKTNLPVEINNWGPKEIIKKPKDIINVPRDIDSQITEDGVKLREDGEKLIETDINVEVIIIEKEKNQDTSPESPEQEENLEDLPPCTIAE